MRVKSTTLTVADANDKRIAALASRQQGYVSRRQLLRLGLGREAINRRVRAGRLISVHTGVYAVGHIPALPLARAFGALLACGETAVLSHSSALTLYGVYRMWDLPFEVTAPTKRRLRTVRLHRARLTPGDITTKHGLPVTSPARTALDNAPRLSRRQLGRAFNILRLDHGLTAARLADVINRFPGHHGCGRLKPLAGITQRPTRSRLERKFWDFCRRYGLPEPVLNHKIAGIEVDAYFPEHRLIVEVDGSEVHSGPVSFEDDRHRDATMLALGLPTVRVTEERMDNAPDREADRLHAILEQRKRAA
jgi:very-short-patch-repair endonuclease